MSFEPDLRAKLSAVTSADIYWDARPQGSALPAVVLEMVIGRSEQHYQGDMSGQGHRVQALIVAETTKEAVEVRDTLITEIKQSGSEGTTDFQGGFINYFGSGSRGAGAANVAEKVLFTQIIDADIWFN